METEDQRNTPQAFSHFTYEASCQSMLVVDVQGVGDVYTDPQIHTIDGACVRARAPPPPTRGRFIIIIIANLQ